MIQEEYKTVRDGSVLKNGIFTVLRAVMTALVVSAAVFAVAAPLLAYTSVPETLVSPIVILTVVFSVIVGAAYAARTVKRRGWLTGALTGVLYSVFLYFISSLSGDGFCVSGYMAVIAAVSMFAGAAGGILGINLSDKRKR